jgi:uncharacterized membrane protein (Fun14 family)
VVEGRMVVDTIITGSLLLPLGGGALLGYITAKALRFIAHIAAIVIGIFVLVLAYLSWKGWIAVHWQTVAEQTQSAAYNASQQVMNVINNAATHYTKHPTLFQTESTPIAALVGFIPGLALGLTH